MSLTKLEIDQRAQVLADYITLSTLESELQDARDSGAYEGELAEWQGFFETVDEPEIYAFGGEHSAVNAIAGNVFEHLRGAGYEEFDRLKGESEEG